MGVKVNLSQPDTSTKLQSNPTPNRETTVTTRPLRIVPSANSSTPTRDVRPRGRARVVIVDDRSTARSLLEGLARTLEPGISVESFSDPFDALAQMQLNTPDLIISDYRMPGMDGIEFTRRIRSEQIGRAHV